MRAAIRVEGLNLFIQGRQILDQVSFEIEEGDYVAILGPNGGGKTSLIKAVLGLAEYQGRIELFGEDRNKFKQKEWIGYVPQQSGAREVDFPATVEEVVLSGLTAKAGLFHRLSPELRQHAEEAMDAVEILPLKQRRIQQLSGGERQRVWMARALAAQPRLLILDEPIAGVDLAKQERFYQLLAKLNRQGLTLLFISHDVGVMAQHANRFLCLNKKLICHSSPENFIKEDYGKKLYGSQLTSITHHHG